MNRPASGRIERMASIVFGVLLGLYPRQFRESVGSDLKATLDTRLEAARRYRGTTGVMMAAFRNAVLMIRDAFAERIRVVRGRTSDRLTVRTVSSSAVQDLRWAWRSLRRTPLFTVLIVLVLAISLGASTAVFSVVDSVLFRPLPLPASGQLVVTCETNQVVEGFCTNSFVNVRDWNDRSRNFAALGAARSWPFMLRHDDLNESINAIMADPAVWRVFQFVPLAGRLFTDRDESQVAVLTQATWQTWFGADPEAVGSTISLGGEPYEIIGVLPADAEVPGLPLAHVWVPIPFSYTAEENREWRGFRAYGRLHDGIDLPSGERELRSISRDLADVFPATNADWGVRIQMLQDYVVGDTRNTLIMFLGAIGFVLVIACINVAHLVLVRSERRTRELAIRAAIGAGPARVGRMLLFESSLLSLGGAALGLFLAVAAVEAFVTLAPNGIPRLTEVHVNWWAVVFLLTVSSLSATLVALAPARLVSSLDVTQALKGTGSRPGHPGRMTSRWMISGQVALTATLLIGAGLLLKSFLAFTSWDPGFDSENLTTYWSLADDAKYETGSGAVAAFQAATEQLEGLPGVSSVSTVSAGPLFGGRETERIVTADDQQRELVVRWFDTGLGYFETMRQPILQGRSFTPADDRGADRVVIVNAAVAERLWPGESPLGKHILIPERNSSLVVVGVVGNITPFTPGTPVEYSIYWPNKQFPRWATFFVVRANAGIAGLETTTRQVMRAVDPDMGVSRFTSMEELVSARLIEPRFNMLLIGTFAVCAMILAAAGVFGVVSYSVARRTREMGIRQSLGATRTGIVRQVMWEGFLPAAIGIMLGVVISFALGGILRNVVFGVSPGDPVTLLLTTLTIAVVAMSACVLPAIKAAMVEATTALRSG